MIPYIYRNTPGFAVLLLFIHALAGCGSRSEANTKKGILDVAEEYVSGQMKSPVKEISENGVIIFEDGERKTYIDPSSAFTGMIDDDQKEDAIITVVSYDKGYLGSIEHLILINTDGKLTMQRSIESDMKILELKEGIITAELPTHPRSSPLYNCSECREVVRYRYLGGELVKAE